MEGSVLAHSSFRATSAWKSTNCIGRGPVFTNLNCCVTSFENSLTSVMRNWFWMNILSCCPKLKLSKRLLIVNFYNHLINKVNKRRRIFVPEPVPAMLRSVHSLPAGLPWKPQVSSERSGQLSSVHKLNCPYSLSSFRWGVISTKRATWSICFSFSKKRENCVAFGLLSSAKKAATSLLMDQKRSNTLPLLSHLILLCSKRSSALASTYLRSSLSMGCW